MGEHPPRQGSRYHKLLNRETLVSRGRKLGRSWQIGEDSTDHGDKTNQGDV